MVFLSPFYPASHQCPLGKGDTLRKNFLMIMRKQHTHFCIDIKKTAFAHVQTSVLNRNEREDGFLRELCAISIKKGTSSPKQTSCIAGRSVLLSETLRVKRGSSIHQSSRWRCPVSVVCTTEHERPAHSFYPFPLHCRQSGK